MQDITDGMQREANINKSITLAICSNHDNNQ